jgi:anaerobic selenocysteine-containing dehydrogenase
MTRTVFRTCTLCEAACGLRLEVEGERIVGVRPDHEDVLSAGYVCPKGIAIKDVHEDPDRLRRPMRRTPSGDFEPCTWEEAFALVADRLRAIRATYGANAVALYVGNPIVHNHGALLLRTPLLRALGTRNSFSAGSQDTSPRFATSYQLYGSSLVLPIPDVDRTQHFLCIGANPVVSNGSLLSAPDMRGRLRAIRARGGKVVVVDPRATETVREADEHVAVRPGSDAALLFAMTHVLVRDGLVDRARIASAARGWEEIERRLPAFTPERAALQVGVDAGTIERLAREFAAAPSSVAYSRVGVCNNAFGTLATFATDLLNLAAGRLGAVGGAMFTTPMVDLPALIALAGGDGFGRWRSRVRGLPETASDIPASALAEEIETAGEGQIRALLTFAGNPVLSTPNGRRLSGALERLEFMVAIDLYVNETTRHADVILPPAWTLAEDHVDLIFSQVFVRNVARWSPAVVARGPEERADWEILLELIERLGGGPSGVPALDRVSRVAKRLGWRWEPGKIVDLAIRLGPHGDRFLPWSRGLNRARLRAAPHGIDLGPLEPGLARRIVHRDRCVHLDAAPLLEAMDSLAPELGRRPPADELLLIGRRELRTNNSWMHNVPGLVSGRERCVLFVHPEDALRVGVADGETAVLESRVYRGELRVQLSAEMRPGVVSLPHGWGHAASARWQRVAGAHPGVSVNDWTDDQLVEEVVGQSVLNGVPVRLRARHAAEGARAALPLEA